MYRRSIDEPEAFWGEQTKQLHWFEEPRQVLEWNPPKARWFADGKTNIAYDCLDRNVTGGKADRRCIVWEGEPGELRTMTYAEVVRETNKLSNALRGVGLELTTANDSATHGAKSENRSRSSITRG